MAGRNISYVKQKEPSFLRKFKKDVGFKEGPNVDTKRGPSMMHTHDDDDEVEEKEDERPQVVVLKQGDLTEDEARKLHGGASPFATAADERPADGRILFRKPAKRAAPEKPKAGSRFAKRKREGERDGGRPEGDSAPQAVKNASLLSFGDDDGGGEGD